MSNIILYVFHRDLRLPDHRGLEYAAELARQEKALVLPAFFFTPAQVVRNPVKSAASVEFMIQSLEELATALRREGSDLLTLYGSNRDCIRHIHDVLKERLKAVVDVRDYTPFAKKRIEEFRTVAKEKGFQYHDVPGETYFTEPGTVLTGSGRVFQKFTPFWERVMMTDIPHPKPAIKGAWASSHTIQTISNRIVGVQHISLREAHHKFVHKHSLGKHAAQKGGREEGLTRLRDLPPKYSDTRDYPSIPSSMLSAHNHFGTVSIREVYWAAVKVYGQDEIRDDGGFIRQLWWRDFNGHLMNAFGDLYGIDPWKFDGPVNLRGKYGEKEIRTFKAWCRGETGFDLVDAGMRSLLTTGFIHNRVRMVCASWLVKDMGVWWRLGERWFAKHLVDYDPAQNLMNWIGICSLAPFGAAPFRRHDPERALERFDADREYVDTYLEDNTIT